ncbi:MAG: alpha/beta fold hydrolase [Gammaproteobacteria bacterium]|nr:MAG: alpha/beta fold hydrolase [Gammaproteobacteria bacterium]UCH41786.1 MAG: alpha/beta fold hydrolase [Gammaproteobacteria bacterium]
MTQLHYSSAGDGEALVVLHGLFGSSRNWQSLSRRFASRFQVFSVDLRNHGQSFHADEMNYPAMAGDLAALLQQLGLESCRILGHSMGGKVAMTLAANYPGLVGRLVIADIAPVSYLHHYDDLIEPILALPLEQIESRTQADHRLRQHIPEDPLRTFLLQNLVRQADGWRWRINWRAIQRDMEFLTGFDEMPAGWRIDLPTLFIRGARSDYVGDAEIDLIRERFGDAEIATIEGAGHWLHAERPEEFAERVLAFL